MNATQLEKKRFGRIPGFAYTQEERIAEIKQAKKDFEAGENGIPHEEFKKQMREKMKSWK